jgi:histidyl-tRNA synthetase
MAYTLPILLKVRQAGIAAEIYPDSVKMKKQMSYANSKNIPFVAIIGENEINESKLTLKNMVTGEQRMLSADELVEAVQ